jgi:hypothetical protein
MPTEEELTAIENFFKQRGAPVLHEVSPLADQAIVAMLVDRGLPTAGNDHGAVSAVE